jgi:hypothetical protein
VLLQLQNRLEDPLCEMQGKGVSHEVGIKRILRQLQAELEAMTPEQKAAWAIEIVGTRVVLPADDAVAAADAQEPAS